MFTSIFPWTLRRHFAVALILASCGAEAPADEPSHDAIDETTVEVVVRQPDTLGLSCPTLALDDALALGRSDSDGCLEVLEDGATLAIVHGIQGGIHLEVRVAAAGSEEIRVALAVDLLDGDTSVARFAQDSAELHLAAANLVATYAFPLIFPSVDATLYHGRTLSLRAVVERDGVRHTVSVPSVVLYDPTLAPP